MPTPGAAAALADRRDATAAAGVTELVYQPWGSDPARELREWASAVA